MPESHHVRRVLWRRRDTEGIEWCELRVGPSGTTLHGTVVMAWDGRPWNVAYDIEVDAGGGTRRVSVDAREDALSFELTSDGAGRWLRDGNVVIDERDALDVDLGFSPSTNTLPIRRLGLAVGESREIGVAWVLFPSFEVQYGRQTYTRLADRRWRYQSAGFDAELTVDEDGLVEAYYEWQAIASS